CYHPTGKYWMTTRLSKQITPMSAPKHHLPLSVNEAETGSVAMNIMPNAKPPSTRCQYHGMENIGFVSEPMKLKSVAVSTIPSMTPATMRQDATRPKRMMAPPIKIIRVDTSPMEPGILPINASNQVTGCPVALLTSVSPPPAAHCESGVAPENPSAAVHTRSPEICAG